MLYLASRAGSFVDGCILLLDGGMLSVRPYVMFSFVRPF